MPNQHQKFPNPITPTVNYRVYIVNSNATVEGVATIEDLLSLVDPAVIKTAYESNANTNAFTDADETKLDGIEAGATADMTNAEIKSAYEANADTNAFTDAEQTKLAGIEAGADVTDGANVTTALSGHTVTSEVVASADEVLFKDTSNSGALRVATAQAVANLKVSEVSEDTTPVLSGVLDANGHLIKLSQGANVASANNITLGDDGNLFRITGTTTINTIATKGVGTIAVLIFDGVLTLTNSADLLCLGGANITTAVDDVCIIQEYATGDWRILFYQRATGKPLTGEFYTTAEQTKLDKIAKVQATMIPSGTTQTVDWTLGDFAVLDLGSASGNVTLTFTAPLSGTVCTLKIIQGSPTRTVILPSSVKMAGRTAPSTINVTAIDDAVDYLTLIYDGTNYGAEHKENFG